MRWRLSWWDSGTLAVILAQVSTAIWAVGHFHGQMVPPHWGVNGPDAYGPFMWGSVAPVFVLTLLALGIRCLDAVMLARKPEAAGFLTKMALGMLLFGIALQGQILYAMARPTSGIHLAPVIGLFVAYMGVLMLTTPNVPMNTNGMLADTPAAQKYVRRGLGKAFLINGLLGALLGLLPGPWMLLMLAPLGLGTIGSLAYVLTKAPAPTFKKR